MARSPDEPLTFDWKSAEHIYLHEHDIAHKFRLHWLFVSVKDGLLDSFYTATGVASQNAIVQK